MELNKELLAKAKEAKTPEELIALAKENGMELTEESAKAYLDLLHPQTGELSDDEAAAAITAAGLSFPQCITAMNGVARMTAPNGL